MFNFILTLPFSHIREKKPEIQAKRNILLTMYEQFLSSRRLFPWKLI